MAKAKIDITYKVNGKNEIDALLKAMKELDRVVKSLMKNGVTIELTVLRNGKKRN